MSYNNNNATYSSASANPGTSLLASRVAEKKRELASLLQLQQLSSDLVNDLESLASHAGSLADGTEAVAAVMKNWGNITRALSLASTNLVNFTQQDYEKEEPLPETLVRVRLPESAD